MIEVLKQLVEAIESDLKLYNKPMTALMLEALSAGRQAIAEAKKQCWCITCRPITFSDMRFVVCPDCGNKRCPKANNHSNICTGSNKVGQKGSSWEHVKPIEQAEKHEPVAWIDADILEKMDFDRSTCIAKIWSTSLKDRKLLETDKPLYTSPQPRKPLTEEKINSLRQQYGVTSNGRGIKEWTQVVNFARAIEVAHGIKE